MSYCRFSCDGFASAVYAYEDCHGGWTVHVAGNTLHPPARLQPLDTDADGWIGEYIRGHEQTMQYVAAAGWEHPPLASGRLYPERRVIHHEHAGESFNFPSESEMFEFLRELQADGLHVPEHAFVSDEGTP